MSPARVTSHLLTGTAQLKNKKILRDSMVNRSDQRQAGGTRINKKRHQNDSEAKEVSGRTHRAKSDRRREKNYTAKKGAITVKTLRSILSEKV